MAKRGKRYQEIAKLVDRQKFYSPAEAIALVKKCATAKFDETVEVAFKLGVDPRHADQQVRGTVILPHGTGREVRVLVFAKADKAEEARQAGADLWAPKIWLRRSRAAGLTLMWPSPLQT